MKARIKETGLITDVSGVKLKKKCVTPRGEEYLEFTFPIEEVEIIKDDIDWEQRRFDLLKLAFQEYSSRGWKFNDYKENIKFIIKEVDAVLKEYRKVDNNEEK